MSKQNFYIVVTFRHPGTASGRALNLQVAEEQNGEFCLTPVAPRKICADEQTVARISGDELRLAMERIR